MLALASRRDVPALLPGNGALVYGRRKGMPALVSTRATNARLWIDHLTLDFHDRSRSSAEGRIADHALRRSGKGAGANSLCVRPISHCAWNFAEQFGCERVRSIYRQRNKVMIITVISTDVCHAQPKAHEIEPQLRRCF